MKVRFSKNSYGFGMNWALECYGKSFWLGQDAKVCHRLLGMTPREVIAKIGTAEIEKPSGNKKLAKLICRELGVKRSNVNTFEPWSLSAE